MKPKFTDQKFERSPLSEIEKEVVKPKLSFTDFVRHEAFSWRDPASQEWAKGFLGGIIENDTHFGDCTKVPCSCYLCTLQNLLDDYQKYFFDYDNWVKDNFA